MKTKYVKKPFELSLLSCVFLISSCAMNNVGSTEGTSEGNVFPSLLPKAPLGYEWTLVANMSDEFDGEQLDFDKWSDHIKTWKGRPPAEFLPENISVKDGDLRIKTSTHPNPSDKWTMAGASVKGNYEMTYGYFESRIKASKTRMSTTFWLTSNQQENQSADCDKRHAIELDILEAIGGWYDESWSHVVHSNTHYKPATFENGRCSRQPYLSKGIRKKTPFNFSDDYHVFSAWWRNPNEMTFYFDGESMGTVKLDHEKDALAFDGPMALRMVAETYYWQTKIAPKGKPAYPTDAELDDPTINTALYDYVRSYELVSSPQNLVLNGDFELKGASWQVSGEKSGPSNKREHGYTHDYGLAIYPNEAVIQQVAVSKNTTFSVSVIGRSQQQDSGTLLQVIGDKGDVLAQRYIDTMEFAPIHFTFGSRSNENVVVRLINKGQSLSFIDNVAVVKK